MPTSSTPPPQQLTMKHFQDALVRHIDEAKPDPLVKNQMMNLRVRWDQKPNGSQDVHVESSQKHAATDGSLASKSTSSTDGIFGSLTLSSEYISIAIHARCQWRIQDDNVTASIRKKEEAGAYSKLDNATLDPLNGEFENEFYFRLGVSASCVPLNEYNKSADKEAARNGTDEVRQKMGRKERQMSRKLRSGMIKRLGADPLIRLLLVDEDKAAATSDGKLLCEALIQHNNGTDDDQSNAKCEERVNVNSELIEGVKNAILSQCEGNLDVLELLLNFPYLPRAFKKEDQSESSCNNSISSSKGSEGTIQFLSSRAFLRILEDAMFDACEKEGEDEMLDDLNISDDENEQDFGSSDRKQRQSKKRK